MFMEQLSMKTYQNIRGIIGPLQLHVEPYYIIETLLCLRAFCHVTQNVRSVCGHYNPSDPDRVILIIITARGNDWQRQIQTWCYGMMTEAVSWGRVCGWVDHHSSDGMSVMSLSVTRISQHSTHQVHSPSLQPLPCQQRLFLLVFFPRGWKVKGGYSSPPSGSHISTNSS